MARRRPRETVPVSTWSFPALASLLGIVALAVGPGVASAHGVPSTRIESPVPLSLVLAGAGATVALTAVWVSFGTSAARPPRDGRHLLTVSARRAGTIRAVAAVAFAALVALALADGLLGRQVATDNLATVFVWPVWIHGLALFAVLVGSLWPTLSPWESLYSALVRLEGREIALLDGSLGRSIERAGGWVAVVGFVALVGVLEPLTITSRSPRLTTGVLAAYGLAMVAGAMLVGRRWLRRADPLGVLYRLFGRVAPVSVRRLESGAYAVAVRPPWRGCHEPVGSVALVVFAVAAVYTVSFDGFADTQAFQTLLFGARDRFGTGASTSVLLYLAGLAGFLVTFGATSWLVERLGGVAGREWVATARWFAPTIVPIAAGYEVAHNYPYVLQNLGTLLELLARPVAPGVGPVDLVTWLPVPAYWASQVGLIVLGHVVAVVAAHRVALTRYDAPRDALRAHLPLVALMIGYTVLSLWIVSRPILAT